MNWNSFNKSISIKTYTYLFVSIWTVFRRIVRILKEYNNLTSISIRIKQVYLHNVSIEKGFIEILTA